MPTLKIERIISFSSEDKVHVANNLLGNITSSKWKCASAGEKQAVVCFQLENASEITGIDIGNEHSAYIEVLVSRSGSHNDYKTFLVMSSFMSSLESRQSTNINRVRMFKKGDFMKPQCEEKWDRIKVVCTQPFNRHVKYGLSFIKFLSNDVGEIDRSNGAEIKLGKFTLRPPSPVEVEIGSSFLRRKQLETDKDKPPTAAAALRDANFSLLNGSSGTPMRIPEVLPNSLRNSTKHESSIESTPKPRHRKELFYNEEDEAPNEKIDKLLGLQKAEKLKKMEESEKTTMQQKMKNEKKTNKIVDKVKPETPSTDQHNVKDQSLCGRTGKESTKRKQLDVAEHSSKKMKGSKRMRPFDKLLEDVVIVISGIQNPDRATLRGQILEMGAKYKPDWDNTCTHLVCAFMNTPKFLQVQGKGKIVTRNWVEECFSQRKKLPWRRYALDKQEKKKDESEDEIWEKIEEVRTSPTAQSGIQNLGYDDLMEQASDTEDVIEQLRKNTQNGSIIQLDDASNEKKNVVSPEPIAHCSKQILDNSVKETNGALHVGEDEDIYSVETDTDEEKVVRKQQGKKKPFDFFKTKIFYIDSNFEDYIDEMLKNYIFIHEGSLVDDPVKKVDYMICGKDEASTLNAINDMAICVLPDWVVDCHKCRQFIPPDEYFVL